VIVDEGEGEVVVVRRDTVRKRPGGRARGDELLLFTFSGTHSNLFLEIERWTFLTGGKE